MHRALPLLVLLAACSSERAQDLPREAWLEVDVGSFPSDPTVLIALTIDDSLGAAALRDVALRGLKTSLERLGDPPCVSDPSRWRPTDWRIVIVFPSREGSDRWLAPATLHYQTRRPSTDTIDDLIDSVEAHLAQRPEDGIFRPLAATRDLIDLAMLDRVAVDEVEATLQSDLAGVDFVELAVAVAREDQSAGQTSDYAISAIETHHIFANGVAPRGQRVWRWTEESYARPYAWPEDAEEVATNGLLTVLNPSCGARGFGCTSRPISGQSCRIFVEPADGYCDPERGWHTSETATCEITPLTDDHGTRCRLNEPCLDCPSGWCRAVPSTIYGICPEGWYDTGLRFTGGAMAASNATFTVHCTLTTP